MTGLAEAIARYGPTCAGLAIGTAAKYGLALTEGRTFTWKSFLGDALLLGLVGLIAVTCSNLCGFTGDASKLAGVLAAVSADRLVELAIVRAGP